MIHLLNDVSVSYKVLNAGIEFQTENDVRNVFKLLSDEGTVINPVEPRPWSACAADVIDKYGVGWFISTPMSSPPFGCLACVPEGEAAGCDLCVRWSEVDFICPKIK